MVKRTTHPEYLNKLIERDINIIPMEEYINAKHKILHKCLFEHTWYAAPSNILSGRGCPECSGNKKNTQSDYINKLQQRNITEVVPIGIIINSSTPLLHKCARCHHAWKIRPYDVFRGKKCPVCTNRGFNPAKETLLYFLRLNYNNDTYYKIGITNHSIENRYSNPLIDKFKIVKEWDILFKDGHEARWLEQFILDKFQQYKPRNLTILPNGNTEILNLYVTKPTNMVEINKTIPYTNYKLKENYFELG